MQLDTLKDLIQESHGGNPLTRCAFIDEQDAAYRYSVTVVSHGVTIVVPLPKFSVLTHLDLMHEAVSPDMHKEHLEAYVHDYKPRTVVAISYALATYNSQHGFVRSYLEGRFGPLLDKARKLGADWWKDASA